MNPETKLLLLIIAFSLVNIAFVLVLAYALRNIIVDYKRNRKFYDWKKSIGEALYSRTSIFCFLEMIFGFIPLAIADSIAECKINFCYYHEWESSYYAWNSVDIMTPFIAIIGFLPFFLLLYSIGISERKNNVKLTINSILFILLFTTQVTLLFTSLLLVIYPELFCPID